MPQDLRPSVRAAILSAFNLQDGPSYPAELKMGGIPEWDSLGHMNLIATLEEKFSVRFPDSMISEITSETAIADIIQKIGKK